MFTTRKRFFKIIAIISLSLVAGTSYYFLNKEDKKVDPHAVYTPVSVLPDVTPVPSISCKEQIEIEYLKYAEVSESEKRNNKFGLYIYAEVADFFEIAQNLVNSNGGEWGYVLIPYNIRDRDYAKWRRVFNQLNDKRLIPVIQLWEVDPDDFKEDTQEAAKFLNEFVWPIRQRYISAYNETNDAKFWRGKVDPEKYANVLSYTIDKFKEENPDFFIMNGAFNISAPTNREYMDALTYMSKMNEAKPGIFERLDGWASHPYPQPNFSGNLYTVGRMGIRAYDVELDHLKRLGVKKDLPVFITETGWAHAEGTPYNGSFYSAEKTSELFKLAFTEIWLKDDKVMAVMPFTIRYDPPFDHFSWINKDNVPYKQYEVVKSIPKVAGNPEKLVYANVKQACP